MGFGEGGFGEGGFGLELDDNRHELAFRIADTLTGKLIGRVYPTEWSFDDPLTGSAMGGLTLPLPTSADGVAVMRDLTRPHACQVCVQDEQGRWWFGGPITAEPAVADRKIKVTFADWRAWFYAASLNADYLGTAVEQMTAMSDLASARLADPGAPNLAVDIVEASGITRDVTIRRTTMAGAALDDIARRDGGPDWWTYLTSDQADPTVVVAHLGIVYPERASGSSLYLRHRLGTGGNILTYTWPPGNLPVSRVVATQGTPPDVLVVTAEDPAVAAGDRLAWDEVWTLPDGVAPESGFEYALARLDSHTVQGGSVEATLDPLATDVGAWGPGDRVRLSVRDGWRDVDFESVRIIGRTLNGRGGHVTGVKVVIGLDEPDLDIAPPTPVVI